MSAVDSAGENAMRGLIGTAFAGGEPALPDVDEVMTAVAGLGAGIRHRQRVRTGVTAAVLCVAGFGMVAGIAAVAHSNHSGGTTVVVPGGSGGPAAPPAAGDSSGSGDSGDSGGSGGSGSGDSGGTSGNGGRLPPP